MASYLEIYLSTIFLGFVIFWSYIIQWRSNEGNWNPRFRYNHKWVYLFKRKRGTKTNLFWDWPILGMLPTMVKNAHRIHDFATEVLRDTGGTFNLVGPWFANMDMVITSDPANVHYILSKHFSNYPKGPEYKAIFSILGDGILNADDKSWEKHRRMTMSLVNRQEFQKFVGETIHNKVDNNLVPVLESLANSGKEVDLQEIFHRLTFDTTCQLVLGYDPDYLSIGLPHCPLERAVNDVEEAILYRHFMPEYMWKLQSWFDIWKEKQYRKGQKVLDHFVNRCISEKRKTMKTRSAQMVKNKDKDCDLLTGYLELCDDEVFVRDSIMNLFVAGTHTISTTMTWFFWILSLHPSVEEKILQEIITVLNPEKSSNKVFQKQSDTEAALMKMVYLNGAISESLRLYPPVPLNHKYSLEKDVLPSGEIVEENTKVLLCFGAMGKMEFIWGKDCLEYKPERWITLQGGMKHEPSTKLSAFNSGPRQCLGKNMSLVQMKIAAISIIYHLSIQVVEGHPVEPCNSVVMQMKHGLKVKLRKRHM